MQYAPGELEGARVLIAEDEAIVAMDHAEQLTSAGAYIVGPCARLSDALARLETDDVDVAVIDYVLGDENTDALQDALDKKNVPYVIVTGYPRVLVRRDDGQTIHAKPVTPEILLSAVKTARDTGREPEIKSDH